MPPNKKPHRHQTPYRGIAVVPHPQPGNAEYSELHYRYAGQAGNIHEVVSIGGRELAKVGFPDKKIVYYFLADLDFDRAAKRGTFHDSE